MIYDEIKYFPEFKLKAGSAEAAFDFMQENNIDSKHYTREAISYIFFAASVFGLDSEEVEFLTRKNLSGNSIFWHQEMIKEFALQLKSGISIEFLETFADKKTGMCPLSGEELHCLLVVASSEHRTQEEVARVVSMKAKEGWSTPSCLFSEPTTLYINSCGELSCEKSRIHLIEDIQKSGFSKRFAEYFTQKNQGGGFIYPVDYCRDLLHASFKFSELKGILDAQKPNSEYVFDVQQGIEIMTAIAQGLEPKDVIKVMITDEVGTPVFDYPQIRTMLKLMLSPTTSPYIDTFIAEALDKANEKSER